MVATIAVGKEIARKLHGLNRAGILEGFNGQLSRINQPRLVQNSQTGNGIPTISDLSNLVKGRLYSDEFRHFVSGHPFEHLITRPLNQLITTSELREVIDEENENSIKFKLFCNETGSIPASTNPESTYCRFAWTRDMANKAIAMIEAGAYEEASKVVLCLAEFYNRKEQRDLLTGFHWYRPNDPSETIFRYRYDYSSHPPIRASIGPDGRMFKSQQPWSHNQLDAIGAWLYVTFRLANVLSDPNNPEHDPNFMKELNEYLSSKVNSDNKIDSIFSVTLKSLNRIQCWNTEDTGAWEDDKAFQRASSIGICLKAAHEAKWYFGTHDWNSLVIFDREGFKGEIDNIIQNCTRVLEERIPKDGREAKERDHIFESDASLSFLLWPYNPGLDPAQEIAILKTLYNNRIGNLGFTRKGDKRNRDVYMGMDYHSNLHSQEIYANPYVPDYKAAEWTLFDPNLSTFHLNKVEHGFLSNGTIDRDHLDLSEFHLRRTLAQVTKADVTYVKRFYVPGGETLRQQVISTKKGQLPEAYFFDSQYVDSNTGRVGRWIANENTPLLWPEGNVLAMLQKQLMVKSLLENYYADIWNWHRVGG